MSDRSLAVVGTDRGRRRDRRARCKGRQVVVITILGTFVVIKKVGFFPVDNSHKYNLTGGIRNVLCYLRSVSTTQLITTARGCRVSHLAGNILLHGCNLTAQDLTGL